MHTGEEINFVIKERHSYPIVHYATGIQFTTVRKYSFSHNTRSICTSFQVLIRAPIREIFSPGTKHVKVNEFCQGLLVVGFKKH